MAEVIKQMKEYGYATYWSGRRYYRDDPQYHYKAVNALIQGGAADLLMYAAIELQDWFDAEKIPARFLNFVHDEIDFEIEDDALEEYGPQIAKRLEMPHLLDIPFLTEAKVGQNLGSLQKRKDWA
jgi:DNA polymerase-1